MIIDVRIGIETEREREGEREREREREEGVTVPDLNYLQSIIADYWNQITCMWLTSNKPKQKKILEF